MRQNMRQNIEAGAGGMTWDRIWNCCHFKSFQSYRRLGPTISWSTSRSFLSTVYNTSPTNFKLENQLWRVCLFVWPSSFFPHKTLRQVSLLLATSEHQRESVWNLLKLRRSSTKRDQDEGTCSLLWRAACKTQEACSADVSPKCLCFKVSLY